MRLIIREEAADDLEAIYDWIAKASATAAARVVLALLNRMESVLQPELINIGRPGRRKGTRELVEWPYIIVYTVDTGLRRVTIISVVHGARNRT